MRRDGSTSRRNYDQACSLATALDLVGERWSLLIVRELALGPMRFGDLAREVGGAPTDVLTRRLRDLEADGIISRRELEPPASAVVYELTELGRGLEPPMLELARWGMNFYRPEDAAAMEAGDLPSALRVLLQPLPDVEMTVELQCEGRTHTLRIANGWIAAERGGASGASGPGRAAVAGSLAPRGADMTITGPPLAVVAALVAGSGAMEPETVAGAAASTGADPTIANEATIEGDPAAIETLLAMVAVPAQLRTRFTQAATAAMAATRTA